MDEICKAKIEAIVGLAATGDNGLQYGIGSIFPAELAHYELYQGYIELHLEPCNPSPLIKGFSDFLKERLDHNPDLDIVQRNFSHFSVRLKSTYIKENDSESMGLNILKLKEIIEPLMEGYVSSLLSTNDIALSLSSYYNSLKEKEAFHINVIDELHANENAHSRILLRLLKYTQGGNLPILQSFLSLLNGWEKSGLSIGKPSITDNAEYIDGLIEEKGTYAIIIENKIHDAVDQDGQIERYVDNILNHGIPAGHIWVVYLTSDGSKIVADYSCTKRVKEIINDRFVPLNYKDDILPWLNEILPTCMIREEWLISALRQYIDHLEGLFGLRASQKETQRKTAQMLLSLSGIESEHDIVAAYDTIRNKEKQLKALLNVASNKREQIEESVMTSFTEISKEYFEARYPDRAFRFNDASRNGYYQVFPEGWPSNVHLEWWNPFDVTTLLHGHSLRLVLHIEQTKNDKIKSLIEEMSQDAAFNALNKKYGFKPKAPTFISFTKELERPFIALPLAERTELIAEIYDNVLMVIPIVDHYLSVKENTSNEQND